MRKSENTKHLNIPGISPVTVNYRGETIRGIRIEAMAKRFITNKYIKCLRDICEYWDNSYYILDTLIRQDIIKQRDDYSMEWTLNKTSLAMLFKKMHLRDHIDDYIIHVSGGFWNSVATLFGEKRETLKKLAHNKITYGGRSEDIEKLDAIFKENGIQF